MTGEIPSHGSFSQMQSNQNWMLPDYAETQLHPPATKLVQMHGRFKMFLMGGT